ncbi:MAG: plasmid mobilization relaxosome protein MobC [Clostridiales bacterium]|nr:plasmid mobilization relaxosome protein MobC [Clostridiales bacterium]
MARPQKDKTLLKDNRITLRFDNTEYERICSNAHESGLSISEYLRKLILNGEISLKYEIVADMPELQRLAAEFGKIGSNLNQIARFFYMGGVRSKAMQDEIHECIYQIFEMRKEISKLAGIFQQK